MKRNQLEVVEYDDTLAIQHRFNDRLIGEVPVPRAAKKAAKEIVRLYNEIQPDEA